MSLRTAGGQQLFFRINIPASRVYVFLKWLVVVNILFLFGTWLHAEKVVFQKSTTAQWFLVQLNFAKENVVAAWYSSMLMFIIGLSAAICFWVDMQEEQNKARRILNVGWLLMAGLFITLSFDEMGSFHEMLSETPLLNKTSGGHGKLLFFVLVGFVAIFMAVFFFVKFKTKKVALGLSILGLLLLLSNPFQEKFEIESWRNSPDPQNWHRPVFYLLLEEGSEIFASLCFLFSFIKYAFDSSATQYTREGKVLKLTSAVGKKFILWPAGFLLFVGLAMWLIHLNAWKIPGDDKGLPEDWPPSAVAFVAFAGSVYLWFKNGFENKKPVYAAIAVASLIDSVYFGSYMYGYWEGPFEKAPYLFLAINSAAALLAVVKLKDFFAKLSFTAWGIFIALSFSQKNYSSTVYGYIAVSFLLLGLFWHYQSRHRQIEV